MSAPQDPCRSRGVRVIDVLTPEWTAEEALRLWTLGHSATEIARPWGLTRNQVIGRLDRMGAPKRSQQRPQSVPDRLPRTPSAHKVKAYDRKAASSAAQTVRKAEAIRTGASAPVVALPVFSAQVDTSMARPWLTRERGECCYPVDGSGADVRSCCLPVKPDAVYCPEHHRRCVTGAVKTWWPVGRAA